MGFLLAILLAHFRFRPSIRSSNPDAMASSRLEAIAALTAAKQKQTILSSKCYLQTLLTRPEPTQGANRPVVLCLDGCQAV